MCFTCPLSSPVLCEVSQPLTCPIGDFLVLLQHLKLGSRQRLPGSSCCPEFLSSAFYCRNSLCYCLFIQECFISSPASCSYFRGLFSLSFHYMPSVVNIRQVTILKKISSYFIYNLNAFTFRHTHVYVPSIYSSYLQEN